MEPELDTPRTRSEALRHALVSTADAQPYTRPRPRRKLFIATVGAFDGDELVGHAALRPFEDALEVKRVYVRSDYRGRGISKQLMFELEAIARERDVRSLILQTGDRQAEAIALYLKIGYVSIDRFGLYEPVPFFLCYGKTLES